MKFLRHSLFDKIILAFLVITIAVFAVLTLYATHTTKQTLAEERVEVLTNEGFLISEQSIVAYINGLYSLSQLQSNLDYYSESLDTSIWYFNSKGVRVASATANDHPSCPNNIHFIDYDYDMTELQTFKGDFYNYFEDGVISVSIPITTNGKPNGVVLLHSTVGQFKELQQHLIKSMYVPFLVMIIISFALLGIISRKVIQPIRKIGHVAEEYSAGNFEAKMEIHSKDEIGQLASTLEYMASELLKLDDYRRAFISNISHDFRSPLTSIKGYAEAIKDGTIPPEKQDRYLGIIVDETKRLSKLTNGLLELNDFDSYGIWLMPREFDVVELIKGAIDTYEGKCIDKGIPLFFNNHAEDSMVYADRLKIQQVIYNLIDNAIKFTPTGQRIFITLTEKRDKVFISVKDEGMGIPKDSLKKIWVRFYKTDASRGRDKNGSGLGLSITREIIKAHNENINVVSTEGVGSEFTFSLQKAAFKSQFKSGTIAD